MTPKTDFTNKASEELEQARLIMEAEAASILSAKDRLGPSFIKALDLITTSIQAGGKVITTGVGKSGKVASKVAATLSSTGTLSLYLHPTEAAHGDLGVIAPEDAVLIFSQSGSSDEIMALWPSFKRLQLKTIAIVGNSQSALAKNSDAVISSEIAKEACPLNLAPTSSTTVAIAIGDAIALCLSRRWNFQEDQFAAVHPGGAIGRRLTLLVGDLMKSGHDLPWIEETAGMDEVVSKATEKPLGGVLVRRANQFVGLITEGDIRRALKHKERFFKLIARDIMTKNPASVLSTDKAITALELMENRPSQISVLPVFEPQTDQREPVCVGLIRLHDLIGNL